MATIEYLKSAKRQFNMYKMLADKSIARLDAAQMAWQPNGESNSVNTIMKHMWGNMLSRWTDFLTTDGEKPWRERDAEFEDGGTARDEVLQKWKEGWKCLFAALDSITDDDLDKVIYIRNEGHTVLEAINRQIAHYSYHVGQIVYVAKMLKDEQWESLSIPRNRSNDYNADKFSKDKERRHFTDDWLTK